MFKPIHSLVGEIFCPIFPDGFLGRPWDDIFELKNIVINEAGEQKITFIFDRFTLELGKGHQIFTLKKNIFIIIGDYALMTFDLYTTPPRQSIKKYNYGVISIPHFPCAKDFPITEFTADFNYMVTSIEKG